ncbi:MAG: PfkB family carbohydrate kinase, partial [Clostridium sp.]
MQLFNLSKLTTESIIYYGKELVRMGAKQVIISLGENGAYLFNENEILLGNAPKGELVNSACAGDTMLATFIGLQELGKTTEESLKTAIAAASSTAFTEGLTDFVNVPLLEEEITIERVRG